MGIVLIALGIAAAAYGVTVMLAWSGTSFFLVWYVIGALLGGAGLLVRLGVWQGLPAIVRHGCTAISALVAVTLAVAACFVITQTQATPPTDLDAIVVLGAQVRSDKTPSVVLQYRLDAAAAYLQNNADTICIVSGGQGFNEPCTEAEAMAAYLEQQGVSASRIILEDKSTSTVENISFSKILLPSTKASVGIVTNDFHCYRAGRIALKQGLANSCTIAARSKPWYFPNNALRECMGIIKDTLAGNI